MSKLGRYEVLEELGKGAMGVVYLAKDPLIGRLVALKTFRVGFAAKDAELEQFRSRFVREAQSAGILSHPNIVTIHDVVDEAEAGVCFIAMEYVRGSNLKTILQQAEPLPFEFVVSILSQVADALDFAHARGVVHRDVKPANILITAENRVKITDFGIARLGSSNLTMEGQLLGTPNYMAPEQIQGREIDHRADIFSLGVVLYELLTRRKPFQGENLTVVTHRIVHEPFAPLAEVAASLPDGVEPVIARALEKDPAKRFQTASELAAELQKLVQRPTPVPPPPASLDDTVATQEVPVVAAAPAQRRTSARWLLWSGAAVAAVALIVAAIWSLAAVFGGESGAVAPTATPDPVAAEVARQLGEARGLMGRGQWVEALARTTAANNLRPGDVDVAALRAEIERAMAAERSERERTAAIEEALGRARAELERRRWADARAAAEEVLALAPDQVEALELRARADEGLARARERLRQARQATAVPEVAAPVPAAPTSRAAATPAPAAASREATLVVDFHSEVSEGLLTVYAGKQQVLREGFRFVKRTGVFRAERLSGGFERRLSLAAGAHTLRVYVAIEGRAARLATVEADLAGGTSHTLTVRVGPAGETSASVR